MLREELVQLAATSGDYIPSAVPLPEAWGAEGRWVAFDTETTGLEWAEDGANVLMATLYSEDKNGRPWYGACSRDRLDKLIVWLQRFVGAGGTLVLQNNKFDFHQIGLDPTTFPARSAPAVPAVLDTAVLAHLVDSRDFKSLANLETKYLGTTTKADYQAAHKGKKGGANPANWQASGEKGLFRYALNDVRVTYKVAEVLWKKVRLLGCEALYRKEVKYMGLLWRIERRGVALDVARVEAAVDELQRVRETMEEELFSKVGRRFMWTSPQQLSKVLYEEYRDDSGRRYPKPRNPYADADGVDRSRFADRGRYNETATSSFLLLEKANHPLGSLILALRETAKLRKVYTGWLELAHRGEKVWTLHTNYNMTGTRTGRISSSRPQLQNVPGLERVHETQAVYSGNAFHRSGAYNLRACIVPRPGYTFLSVDHQQQEGRLFGIISSDPNMRMALENKLDIHMMVAKLVWGDQGEAMNKLHREWAKTISFGMIYGMTTGSLQHRLNKTPEEANAIADKYLETFPRIGPFLQEVVRQVRQAGYVRYWSGRIWRETDKNFAYKGANALVQGGSADLISVAALRCQSFLDDLSRSAGSVGGDDVGHLVLIVHDELVFEVKDERLEEVTPKLLKIMEVQDLFGLPFPADAKIGKSFGEMEKLK